MSLPILAAPVRFWKCPTCGAVDRTEKPGFITQMHNCPALGNISLPLQEVRDLEDTPDARHVLTFREDYVGDADPVASVRTERGDGSNDVNVFAPLAIGFGEN